MVRQRSSSVSPRPIYIMIGFCNTASPLTSCMDAIKTLILFIVTALAEIIGCYLPYLWLKKGATPWLILPAALSLASFAWLLTLHPTAAARVYAAYGGVYVAVALFWMWGVDAVKPNLWDFVGAGMSLAGMGIIMFAPRHGA
jgi:small multidrug resistance family-3 protein